MISTTKKRDEISRNCFDLSLYLVLDPILCGGIAGMVETTRIAIQNGVTFVQLRSEKEVDKGFWYEAGVELMHLVSDYSVPLVVNDHVDVAMAINADGVHVGQSDLPVTIVRDLIGKDKIVGLSVGSFAELNRVDRSVVDYVGVGPVFATSTKKDAREALGISNLQMLVESSSIPKVAIGGINQSNVESVMSTKVDGVAVVSAICGQKNIASAVDLLAKSIKGSR